MGLQLTAVRGPRPTVPPRASPSLSGDTARRGRLEASAAETASCRVSRTHPSIGVSLPAGVIRRTRWLSTRRVRRVLREIVDPRLLGRTLPTAQGSDHGDPVPSARSLHPSGPSADQTENPAVFPTTRCSGAPPSSAPDRPCAPAAAARCKRQVNRLVQRREPPAQVRQPAAQRQQWSAVCQETRRVGGSSITPPEPTHAHSERPSHGRDCRYHLGWSGERLTGPPQVERAVHLRAFGKDPPSGPHVFPEGVHLRAFGKDQRHCPDSRPGAPGGAPVPWSSVVASLSSADSPSPKPLDTTMALVT